MVLPAVTRRTDARGRFREEAAFLPFRGSEMFAVTYLPVATPRVGHPLLLWEPVVRTERYFQELLRSRRVRELRDGRVPANDWREEMAGHGHVDILGHAFHRGLYETGQSRRLDALLAGTTHPTMIVQFRRGRIPRPEYQRLQEAMAREGGYLEIGFVHDEPAWFFPGHQMKVLARLLSLSADWLCRVAEGMGSRG